MQFNMGKLGLVAGIGCTLALIGVFIGRSLPSSQVPLSTNSTQGPATPAEKGPVRPEPVPPADGFDFPVGPPDAKKYYNAQGFQRNNHLGEDWSGVGGGNTDKGDPVHCIGIGRVASAEDHGPGWGNVVRIFHNIGSQAHPILIESLYAHLDQMTVNPGQTVARGQKIGTIGDANGAYWAHLHLELRWQIDMELGGGYSPDTTGFLVPTTFIKTHRPMRNE